MDIIRENFRLQIMSKKKARGPGRPKISKDEIHWHVRLDEATDKALKSLAKRWDCSRSEAMRRAVTETAKKGRRKKKL